MSNPLSSSKRTKENGKLGNEEVTLDDMNRRLRVPEHQWSGMEWGMDDHVLLN